MYFPDSYFEDEVRDGFYVSSFMKRAWAAQLEVLDGIQKVCKKHHIQYFAEWGTLLGAIRHGGMIPWDDDFDICMTSEEYNKFLAVADELPNGCYVSDYRKKESYTDNMVTRVENSNLAIVSKEILQEFHGFPYIAGIDIFRLDSIPKSPKLQEEYRMVVLYIAGVIGLIGEKEKDEKSVSQNKINDYLRKIEKICGESIPRDEQIKKRLHYLLMEVAPAIYEDKAAEMITNLPKWSDNSDYQLPKVCFDESVSLPFENTEICVPVGYEELLQKKYGGIGYMKPVRIWDGHEYPYFRKLKKYLTANTALEFFEYDCSDDVLEIMEQSSIRNQNVKRDSLQQRIKGFLPLFQEAHQNLDLLIREENYSIFAELLEECQNTAIQIGTMIEEERGEGHSTVKILEEYCEILFRIHENLFGNGKEETIEIDLFFERLRQFEKQLEKSIENELKDRKEIVLIPYKAAYWNALESVWQAAMESTDTDVYVIPAPYYYKDDLGKEKMNEPHYEIEGYPEQVTITSYEKYNFEVHHPDTIIIQCPYDEFNFAMTIHPFFYVKNLKQYTNQLVYIPALMMDDIDVKDERAKEMLKAYCNMPGVVNADKVFVQSEQMKKIYVELLTDFAGEDTKEIWENKIYGIGSPVSDYELKVAKNDLGCPQDWLSVLKKTDGTWRKVVLYSTSASALLCHGEKMLDKMKQVIQAFREQQEDIALIWRPDRKAREMLRKSAPGLWQQYRDLVQKYKEEAWGIYDESPDAECAITLCDACYGDGGVVFNACRTRKKVIMLQRAE